MELGSTQGVPVVCPRQGGWGVESHILSVFFVVVVVVVLFCFVCFVFLFVFFVCLFVFYFASVQLLLCQCKGCGVQ